MDSSPTIPNETKKSPTNPILSWNCWAPTRFRWETIEHLTIVVVAAATLTNHTTKGRCQRPKVSVTNTQSEEPMFRLLRHLSPVSLRHGKVGSGL